MLDESLIGARVRIHSVAYPEGAHRQHIGTIGVIFAVDHRKRQYWVDPGEPLPIRGCFPENLELIETN